jgi:uncharacterized membrane protein
MSIQPMEGDMEIATNPTLAKMMKKINELVSADKENIQSLARMRNDIADCRKEIKDIQNILRNRM